MKDPDHPIWPIVRIAVIALALTFFLWLNASNFDGTEIKSILEMLIVVGGLESLGLLVGKKK